MSIRLGELATRFGCELVGDPDVVIQRVGTLENASDDALSFLANPSFKRQLKRTRAAAVVVRPDDAGDVPNAALIHSNPYAAYARMARVLYPVPAVEPGLHETAVVASDADVHAAARVEAGSVVAGGARIGAGAFIGPGCYVGPGCAVGAGSQLVANVTLVRDVVLGERCELQPGAVIGADGFGNAMTEEGWIKVPQVGGVRIGDDVGIGANTTIDCGAVDDTIIEDGVRIDNLCMIAHNVHVGAHTAMAGMTGIAGSARIGKRCMFGGKSGSVGHVSICDDVVVLGKCMITKDITEPGTYVSSFPQELSRDWKRTVARVRALGKLFDRVSKLEKT
ncbi:MAG: UDP-3-O-(3-hydroxymyristoyl)glucosamine N-acyltransferase [Pseudomonadota bacterium]